MQTEATRSLRAELRALLIERNNVLYSEGAESDPAEIATERAIIEQQQDIIDREIKSIAHRIAREERQAAVLAEALRQDETENDPPEL